MLDAKFKLAIHAHLDLGCIHTHGRTTNIV